MGGVPNRKEARKKKRQDKSEKKRVNHLNVVKEQDRQADEKSKQRLSSAAMRARKRQRLEVDSKESFVNEDDEEIEYLERKLGLSKKKNQKNKELSWNRLSKEFEKDGLGSELTDFIKDIDRGVSFTEMEKQDSKRVIETVDSDSFSESVDSENEEVEEELTNESKTTAIEGASKENVESDDESESKAPMKNVTFMPKSNLYGESLPLVSEPRKTTSFFKDAGEATRLRKLLNGLINRMAESNLQPIASQISALYKEHPARSLNQSISGILCSSLSEPTFLLTPLATCFAALVSALSVYQGNEMGAFITEQAVLHLDKVFNEDKVGVVQLGGERVVSKRACNMAIFLSHLFTFGLTNSTLVFDLLIQLANNITENGIEIIAVVLNEIGNRLRKDDPAKLLQFIETIQQYREDDAGQTRMQFLLKEVYDLKNNRKLNNDDSTRRLKKFLQNIRQNTSSSRSALQLTWDDLLHAEERGRWWVVGGVWKNQEMSLQKNKEAMKGTEVIKLRGKGSVGRVLSSADPSMLALAKKHRMNTDIRRAVFCEMMSAQSPRDAMDKIIALNLKDIQEREIVHVLIRCCGACQTYNLFFEELACSLCSFRHQFKFTFQLSFWDTFKELEEMKPRRAANLARMLSYLVAQYSLSLAILKPVDFTALGDQGVLFFNIFFNFFLCTGGDSKEGARRMARSINRLGASDEFERISDGIQLFLHHHLVTGSNELLAKRVKISRRIMDALILNRNTQGMAEEQAPDVDNLM